MLLGQTPREKFWEETSLPIVPGLTPGTYNLADTIEVDQYGRVISISANPSSFFYNIMQDWTPVSGTFNTLNFQSPITVTDSGGGVLSIDFSGGLGVEIRKNGVALPDTRYNILNFRGANFTLVDSGPNMVDIYVGTGGATLLKRYMETTIGTANVTLGGIPAASKLSRFKIDILSPYDVGSTITIIDTSTLATLVPSTAFLHTAVGEYVYDFSLSSPVIVGDIGIQVAGATTGSAILHFEFDSA